MRTLYLSPYRHATSLRDAMDRLFDESFVGPHYGNGSLNLPVDVQALNDEYIVRANVPGLTADDLEIQVLDNSVSIRGEYAVANEADEAGTLLRERHEGKFSRTLTLPTTLNAGKAVADLENGVLTLRIPKADEARPRTIAVKSK